MEKKIKMNVFTNYYSPSKIMEMNRDDPEPGKITKNCRAITSKTTGISYKDHVLGILGKGNNIGLMEFHKHCDNFFFTMICKS